MGTYGVAEKWPRTPATNGSRKSHTILDYGFAAWKLPLCRQGALPPPEYFSRNYGGLEYHQVVFVYDNFGGFFAQQCVDFGALLA